MFLHTQKPLIYNCTGFPQGVCRPLPFPFLTCLEMRGIIADQTRIQGHPASSPIVFLANLSFCLFCTAYRFVYLTQLSYRFVYLAQPMPQLTRPMTWYLPFIGNTNGLPLSPCEGEELIFLLCSSVRPLDYSFLEYS